MIKLFIFIAIVAIISAYSVRFLSQEHEEFADRLAAIPEQQTVIDNKFYDSDNFANHWWDVDPNSNNAWAYGLHAMNEARFKYFWKHIQTKLPPQSPFQILDIGCGGGILTERFAREDPNNINITGVDISPKSIETARKHAAKSSLKNIQYIVGSAYEVPVPDNSMDVVVMSDVLEHLHDLNKAIKEVRRVLKSGGLFVFDTINRTTASRILFTKVGEKLLKIMPVGTHDYRLFIKPEEMKVLLERNGFKLHLNEIKGLSPKINSISHGLETIWMAIRRRSSFPLLDLLGETDDINVSYMGYAKLQ